MKPFTFKHYRFFRLGLDKATRRLVRKKMKSGEIYLEDNGYGFVLLNVEVNKSKNRGIIRGLT